MTSAPASPQVSVVIPTFNRAHTIEASVASVLAEGTDALDVVVVDDGSTDDTVARLERHRDPRVRIVRAPHAGIAATRNRGLGATRAPVVAFHDSDDLVLPGRFSAALAAFSRDPGIAFVVMNGRMLPPEDRPSGAAQPWIAPATARTLAAGTIGAPEVFRWNLGQLQGMSFRRQALDAVGPLDGQFTILDDLDLVLRVAARFRGVFLDQPAFAYRQHAGGVARNRLRLREESIALGDKLARLHPEVIEALGRDRFMRRQARRWARVASMRARAHDAAGARAAIGHACRLEPWDLRWRWRALRLWWAAGR